MTEHLVIVYQEPWYTAFIPGGGKVDPHSFSNFLNSHAADGWTATTMQREIRRTLFFLTREAFVVVMTRAASAASTPAPMVANPATPIS